MNYIYFLPNDTLIFGVKYGMPVHIDDVESGLACGCTCPFCGEPLIARKGKVRTPHFAHVGTNGMGHAGHEAAYQTQLHLLAKNILKEAKQFLIPDVSIPDFGGQVIGRQRSITVDSAELEKSMGSFIPDIILTSKGKKLLVEIYVTHKTGPEKIKKIAEKGLSCIEIDLSDYCDGIDLSILKQALLKEVDRKEWLYNARAEVTKNGIHSFCENIPLERVQNQVRTLSCPIFSRMENNKSYAYYRIDCQDCIYLRERTESSILCSGQSGMKSYSDYLMLSKKG